MVCGTQQKRKSQNGLQSKSEVPTRVYALSTQNEPAHETGTWLYNNRQRAGKDSGSAKTSGPESHHEHGAETNSNCQVLAKI